MEGAYVLVSGGREVTPTLTEEGPALGCSQLRRGRRTVVPAAARQEKVVVWTKHPEDAEGFSFNHRYKI